MEQAPSRRRFPRRHPPRRGDVLEEVGPLGGVLVGQQGERRDLARKKDPNFERDLHRNIAAAGPEAMRTIAAVNRAMPALQQAVDEAQDSIDRITANLPDPTYPRR